MELELGDNHTVDVSGIVGAAEKTEVVRMHLFSRCRYRKANYGLYEVRII